MVRVEVFFVSMVLPICYERNACDLCACCLVVRGMELSESKPDVINGEVNIKSEQSAFVHQRIKAELPPNSQLEPVTNV